MQNVNKPRGGGSVFDDEQTAFVRLKRVGSADAAMASAIFSSSRPVRLLYKAEHFLSTPNAWISAKGMRASGPPMGKLIMDLAV